MITRLAASFFIVATAAILSAEVFARASGGFMGGRASVHAHRVAPTVARPGGALIGGRGVVRAHAFQRSFFAHRGQFGNGAWNGRQWYGSGYGVYDNYGPYDYDGGYNGGTSYASPYETPPPAYPAAGYPVGGGAPEPSQKVIYVMPYRPGCDSETQRVPAMGGGERAVRIVRC